jgi:uncharacterized protein (TIGR02284 family)
MKTNENVAEVLNDLILINNDRIEGYEKAAEETNEEDADLKTMFNNMADESRQYVADLSREVTQLGASPAEGTTNSGKLYRVWMGLKNSIVDDRHSILASCEFGEDAAQKTYQAALEDEDIEMAPSYRDLISRQKASLKQAHDLVKKYRDAHETVSS